jgi:hypothetical protein
LGDLGIGGSIELAIKLYLNKVMLTRDSLGPNDEPSGSVTVEQLVSIIGMLIVVLFNDGVSVAEIIKREVRS